MGERERERGAWEKQSKGGSLKGVKAKRSEWETCTSSSFISYEANQDLYQLSLINK